jgi:hypothetical protein
VRVEVRDTRRLAGPRHNVFGDVRREPLEHTPLEPAALKQGTTTQRGYAEGTEICVRRTSGRCRRAL